MEQVILDHLAFSSHVNTEQKVNLTGKYNLDVKIKDPDHPESLIALFGIFPSFIIKGVGIYSAMSGYETNSLSHCILSIFKSFVNGKLEGYYVRTYGKCLREIGTFSGGLKSGLWRRYIGDLKIKEGYYSYGVKKGLWTAMRNKKFYVNGKLKYFFRKNIFTLYHPNGKIKEKGIIKDGKKNGFWKYWNMNGVFQRAVFYRDGITQPKSWNV